MFEKQNVDPLNIQNTQCILNLNSIPASNENELISITLQKLQDIINSNSVNTLDNLIMQGKEITEEAAEKIYDFVKQHHQFTLNIDLPKNLENSKLQIKLDQLIADQRLEKKQREIESRLVIAEQPLSQKPVARIIPKGKISPPIEVTLHEELDKEAQLIPILEEKILTIKLKNNLPTLTRSPIAPKIITQILPLIQAEWPKFETRHEEQTFRKNLGSEAQFNKENHPLVLLIKDNERLNKAFEQWNKIFKQQDKDKKFTFDIEQYNAFLDVYGQYGEIGLIELFRVWEKYNNNHSKEAFLDTYILLLKHMPSYLPFIEDQKFQDTISEIAQLSSGTRSWWMALIQNHGRVNKYNCLPSLLQQFNTATLIIQNMGLSFDKIETIQHAKDLSSTLNEFLELLNKCPLKDQAAQWACVHKITIPNPNPFHFIIPDMRISTDLKEQGEIGWIKKLLAQDKNSNPELVKPAFYRYIATQKQHLPIEKYKEIINRLFSIHELDNEARIRMLYILAKSTSTQTETGFNATDVLTEWQNFEARIIRMDTLNRIKANFGEGKVNFGLRMRGGTAGARIAALAPIMDKMPAIPPMSYLNKLLQLSEYKFLHEGVSLLQLESIQADMMNKMIGAASLYKDYPEKMMHAIRLIKTKELVAIQKDKKNAGKYISEEQDITLLEKFISACNTFIDPRNDSNDFPELSPKQVLLPLLTIFHLEYEDQEILNQLIQSYNKKLTDHLVYKEKINLLLPYGLSLLQLIQERKTPKLNWKDLIKIQEALIGLSHDPSSTKKDIRKWMHDNYGNHFKDNELLNIVDEVNLNSLFERLQCTQEETRSLITGVVSNFNNQEEKDQHEDLVKSLINLTKILNPSQKVQFFEYCKNEFKINGLFSREQHTTPDCPAYLKQFTDLVNSMADNRFFEEFEQYINIAQKYQSNQGDVKNTLAKCTYLLNELYPLLMKKGAARKEAFNFSAELICISSLNALNACHEEAIITMSIDYPKEFHTLEKLSSAFMASSGELGNTMLLNQLQKIEEHISSMLIVVPNNKEQFKDCNMVEKINEAKELIIPKHQQTMFGRMKNVLWASKKPTQEEIQEHLEESFIRAMKKKQILYETFKEIKIKENRRFANIMLSIYMDKDRLARKYSNIATHVHDFISSALKTSPDNISRKHNDVRQLIDQLIALDDQNLVLSLTYHYSRGLLERQVEHVIELFNDQKYKECPLNLKKNFIHAVIAQMNNSVVCSKEDIQNFLVFIHKNRNKFTVTQALHEYYQHAPFPPLLTFTQWINEAVANAAPGDEEQITKNIKAQYRYFDKYPCAFLNHNGREQENGFKLEFAERLIGKIPEITNVFTYKYLLLIEEEQEQAQSLSTQKILDELKKFKNNPPTNHIKMVMLLAELLHRCKGRIPAFLGNRQVAGRSFELNTTQIIAILSLLEAGNKITAEIGTGEGKSRIIMILSACQFLKGKTVDFLTSNLALAARDYLQSLPFFNSLGAKVNFITSSSGIQDYEIGGINTSDPENLCLFRNKAFSRNESDLVLHPDPNKRALLLDEADVIYFGTTHLEYNYSSIIPQINIDLLPLFPLLMDFFAEQGIEEIYLHDKQRCNDNLLTFIKIRNLNLFELLKPMPISQLEKWQDAAYSARRLEYNVDYTIVSDATISTSLGKKIAAAAMCYIGPRISQNAIFSKGVHQCLHAELNRLMKIQNPNTKDPRHKVLEQCKHNNRVFLINPIRKITVSSTSNMLLKAYAKSDLHAVTGTIGSEREQKEARSKFDTQFISIPRHHGIRRVDHPARIVLGKKAQLDALAKHILISRAKDQPILLVCKDDNESEILYDQLAERLKTTEQLTRIHAGIHYEEEAYYIKNDAGRAGQITITTEMEGRGVDIELQGKAHHTGLKVLLTYLPDEKRDYGQLIGRAGRYGDLGETQMILNLDDLKKDFNIDQIDTTFYLNPEAFILKLQTLATHTKALRRLFDDTYDNHFSHFLGRYTALPKEDEIVDSWSAFLEEYHRSKELTLQKITNELEEKNPDITVINKQLEEHSVNAKNIWTRFISKLAQNQKEKEAGVPIPNLVRPKLLEKWFDKLKDVDKNSMTTVDKIETVRLQEEYDPTAGGQVQVVKNPPLLASYYDIRAAWRGEGILSPNFHAWRAGQLSSVNFLSQLPVFCWIFSPKEETYIVKRVIPTSHALLYREVEEDEEKNDTKNKDHHLAASSLFRPRSLPQDNQESNTNGLNLGK